MLPVPHRSRLHSLSTLATVVLFGATLLATLATPAQACPDWRQNGQTVSYDAGQLDRAQSFAVQAGGPYSLSQCPTPGTGWAAAAPHLTLSLRGHGGGRALTFRVEAPCDTVLLVNDANARWHFNDDSQGLNPGLTLPAAADGVYDIWIGTYGQAGCTARLEVQTSSGGAPPPPPTPPAATCPDPGQNGQILSYDAQGLWVPQRFNVVAGGTLDLRACGSVPGHGWIIQRPDFTLNLAANPHRYDLEFRVEAGCDPVLLVNDWRGQWHFNDDADGLNSRLRIAGAQAGAYDIWVGTYGAATCQATLIAETFASAPPPPPPPACPDPGLTGAVQRQPWSALAGGLTLPVRAGGAARLADCAAPGTGYADARPQITLDLRDVPRGGTLDIRATASCDTVLLVSDPAGRWSFNDDRDGLNPGLTLEGAMAGRYAIWLGTYSPTPCDGHLMVQGVAAEPTKPGRPQPPTPIPGRGDLIWRFLSSPMGWTARDAQLSMVPGSHMQITAWGDSRVGYLIAPSEALGDWRRVTSIEAEIRTPGTRYFDAFTEGGVGDLVIYNGTMTAAARFPHWLGPDWARVEVQLREAVTSGGTRLWQLGGGARSLDEVLANVTAFHVRGEFRLGDTTADVSEIAIRGQIVPTAGVISPRPPVVPGGPPAAAGQWRILANGHQGSLDLIWENGTWRGTVLFTGGAVHVLEGIRFDPATGAVEFIRPIGGGSTQHYRGVLSGAQMSGQFNQGGGAFTYTWTATR